MKYVQLFILLIVVSSCKDNSTNSSNDALPKESSYFPNAIGSSWVYLISSGTYFDTLKVSIVGDTILPNGVSAKIWSEISSSYQTTFYVYSLGDTIEVRNDNNLFAFPRLIIPFTVGNKWAGFSQDTIYVSQDSVYSFDSKANLKAFCLMYQKSGYQWSYWSATWFAPAIGVIKKEGVAYSRGFEYHEIYTLLSHSIK